jgi:hypothetical protein
MVFCPLCWWWRQQIPPCINKCLSNNMTSHPRKHRSSIINAVCLKVQKQIRNAVLKGCLYCFYINHLHYNYLQNCSHHIPVPIKPILMGQHGGVLQKVITFLWCYKLKQYKILLFRLFQYKFNCILAITSTFTQGNTFN